MGTLRANVLVNGIVQGVGFRPFIHRQVARLGLSGWIRNTPAGAEIELEGDETLIDSFVSELRQRSPRLAVIISVEARKHEHLRGYQGFRILESLQATERTTLVSPDVCICEDCLRELFDSDDRRYRYPFINCTNCGPRFTIIRDVPYDRQSTTMEPFKMCAECAAEYADISDRRYHAQPDCCPECGPELFYLDENGDAVDGDPLELARQQLMDGGIVAVKGLGGIHLACRCDDPEIACRLRRRKRRDEKPFAVMCRDLTVASELAELTPEESELLNGPSRPIVLLRKKRPLSHISENGYIGIMLPYTPLHYLLLEPGLDSLIMTSANLSDLPIMYKNDEAVDGLRGIADGFLLHDREIDVRCDDSLFFVVDGREYPVRRSRGYVPLPVTAKGASAGILACGAEQKATFSLSRDGYIFPSQHIGDLKNAETLLNYETQILRFQRLFDIQPRLIACDLHPDYLSSVYAEERAKKEGLPIFRVQHHHAHMASCMADNGLDGNCIGVIWDGVGLGTDGTAWGGEFLTGGYGGFERRGSLQGFRLPGGDLAVKELWRVGASLMLQAGLDPNEIFPGSQTATVRAMLDAGLNCPVTSSMGRLFDGVSAILGICGTASYEGQGAVLLEAAATQSEKCYTYNIDRLDGRYVFIFGDMLRELCRDRQRGVPAGETAAGFMNTVVEGAADVCRSIRQDTGLDRIVLSGGCFQNLYMLLRLTSRLREHGFEVYRQSRVSANDEGICLGQTMIAENGGGVNVSCHTHEDN